MINVGIIEHTLVEFAYIKGEVILKISEDLTLFLPLDVYYALLWNTDALVKYLNILKELGNGVKLFQE